MPPTTASPTKSPTSSPSLRPTLLPTKSPTLNPTPTSFALTSRPTYNPTFSPPTIHPTPFPTELPTLQPSRFPTAKPTSPPTTSTPTIDPDFLRLIWKFPFPYPRTRFTAWSQLNSDDKSIARSMGYTRNLWDNLELYNIESVTFNGLTESLQQDAVALGLDRSTWDCFVNHVCSSWRIEYLHCPLRCT